MIALTDVAKKSSARIMFGCLMDLGFNLRRLEVHVTLGGGQANMKYAGAKAQISIQGCRVQVLTAAYVDGLVLTLGEGAGAGGGGGGGGKSGTKACKETSTRIPFMVLCTRGLCGLLLRNLN